MQKAHGVLFSLSSAESRPSIVCRSRQHYAVALRTKYLFSWWEYERRFEIPEGCKKEAVVAAHGGASESLARAWCQDRVQYQIS